MNHAMHRKPLLIFLTATIFLVAGTFADAPTTEIAEAEATFVDLLSRGDRAWAQRGSEDPKILKEKIGEAVAAYEEALTAEPENPEAVWKLLRALQFQGTYATSEKAEKQEIFDRGFRVFEQALMQLPKPEDAEQTENADVVAKIYFWGAVNLGKWGQVFGKLAAVRQGVADKIRDYNLAVNAFDPSCEDAGGYRVLGRLHTEAPKVPFFTGWIDRKTAVSFLREAVEISSDEPGNVYFLADALHRFESKSREEAIELLSELVERSPRPTHLVEDADFLRKAERLLKRLQKN